MKITIEKTLLETVLLNMQTFLEKKDASQITTHVYIKAQNSQLTIKATDYEIGLEVSLDEVNIIEDGIITSNGKKLLDIIKILKNAPISLTAQNNMLYIDQGNSQFKLPMFKSSEFPEFPILENSATIQINAQDFVSAFKKITSAADNNNPKFELNAALLDIHENYINFVATDTRRLAIVTINQKSENALSLIIPKKAIVEIQKLFFDDLTIIFSSTYLVIQSKQFTFFTKIVNGKYPEYTRIIPSEERYKLSLPKAAMIDAIKQITIVSTDIKVTFHSHLITFDSLSDDNFEAKTEIAIETPFTEEFSIAINSRYILDFLAQIDTQDFSITLNKTDLPFTLQSNNFKTIIMPIVM